MDISCMYLDTLNNYASFQERRKYYNSLKIIVNLTYLNNSNPSKLNPCSYTLYYSYIRKLNFAIASGTNLI